MSAFDTVTVWITPYWYWQDTYHRLPAWVQRKYQEQRQ